MGLAPLFAAAPALGPAGAWAEAADAAARGIDARKLRRRKTALNV